MALACGGREPSARQGHYDLWSGAYALPSPYTNTSAATRSNGTPLAIDLSVTGGRADKPGDSPIAPRGTIMADTIREKIENAGDAAKDAAKKVGDRVQEGADKAADKAADATEAAGQK